MALLATNLSRPPRGRLMVQIDETKAWDDAGSSDGHGWELVCLLPPSHDIRTAIRTPPARAQSTSIQI